MKGEHTFSITSSRRSSTSRLDLLQILSDNLWHSTRRTLAAHAMGAFAGIPLTISGMISVIGVISLVEGIVCILSVLECARTTMRVSTGQRTLSFNWVETPRWCWTWFTERDAGLVGFS